MPSTVNAYQLHHSQLRIIITCLLFSFSLQFVEAQPTQAEIDKMIKQAKDMMKKVGTDSTTKKAIRDAGETQRQVMDGMKNTMNADRDLSKPDTAVFTIAPRNTRLLKALPIRTFNRAELVSYLHNLNIKLSEYLRNTYQTSIENLPVSVTKQTGTATGLWMKGKINESILVSIGASELQPDNNLRLNNTGGILTTSGLAFYGIPILDYALGKQPDNNIILNNLGQAYLDLGDDKKAEEYLLRCIKSYTNYPDANLALACIYNSRGQKATAIRYAENSLKGAYSAKASTLLKKLKPDLKLMDYVRHRYKQPAYFKFDNVSMLPQCYTVAQIAMLEPQYVAFREMIDQTAQHYSRLLQPVALGAQKSITDKINSVPQTKQTPYRPFGAFGNKVLDAMKTEYQEKFRHLDSLMKAYYRARGELNKKYEVALAQMRKRHENTDQLQDEVRCRELDALSNSYLPLYAEQTEMIQPRVLSYYKSYLNDMAYWSYIASVNDDQFYMDFYRLVFEFLGRMKEINTTRFMESKYDTQRFYPCAYTGSSKGKADSLVVETPDCYLSPKIEFDLGAFKMEVSCETYKLEAGEGLIGKIEYARSSGEVTLAFGVGMAVPRLMYKSPALNIGAEGELKSQFYITFDRGGPVDMGVLWEAEVKAIADGGGVKASLGVEEGLTAGFGSGLVMKENSQLKQAIDKTFPVQPDDAQINKNIPLYKK